MVIVIQLYSYAKPPHKIVYFKRVQWYVHYISIKLLSKKKLKRTSAEAIHKTSTKIALANHTKNLLGSCKHPWGTCFLLDSQLHRAAITFCQPSRKPTGSGSDHIVPKLGLC